MRKPKNLYFSFVTFKTPYSTVGYDALGVLSKPREVSWTLNLKVSFEHLEPMKEAINACCANGIYVTDFAGELLFSQLQLLALRGFLDKDQVSELGLKMKGSIVRFCDPEEFDFEVIQSGISGIRGIRDGKGERLIAA